MCPCVSYLLGRRRNRLKSEPDHDLVVVGASNDWRQEEYLSGSIPDKIANRVACSALMVRSAVTNDLKLSSIFWEQMIRLDLRPTDKWDAINQMIEVLIEEEQFPSTQRQRVLESALERAKKFDGAGSHYCHPPRTDSRSARYYWLFRHMP